MSTTHVHTKPQTYEIDEQIVHGETTQKEILKKPTNKIEITSLQSFNSYQKPGYTNETYFLTKHGGFTPDFDTKNYTLAIFLMRTER